MDKEKNEKDAIKECICRMCSSFVECNEKIAYCVIGKSKCIKEEKGCICGGCPVYAQLGLKGYYFCMRQKK